MKSTDDPNTESLLLSAAERDRFAAYLERSATSGAAIVQQFEKLGSLHAAMSAKLKAEVAAERIVAAKLRATQEYGL